MKTQDFGYGHPSLWSGTKGRPAPVDARSHNHWFQHIAIIVSDMQRAYQWLRHHKVQPVSTGPQRLPVWNPKAAGIQAFYCKNPDGHALEILQFPSGKGDQKRHRPTERLFLGIDHTASFPLVSAGVVTLPESALGFTHGMLVRDPDGHAMQLIAK
jgi:hypothetical protein